jgi:hypothetical protein
MRHDPSTFERNRARWRLLCGSAPSQRCSDRVLLPFSPCRSVLQRTPGLQTEGDPDLLARLVFRIAAAACREAHGRRPHLPIDPDQALREQVGPNRVVGRRRECAPLQPAQRGIFVIVQAKRASHNRRNTQGLRRDTSAALIDPAPGRPARGGQASGEATTRPVPVTCAPCGLSGRVLASSDRRRQHASCGCGFSLRGTAGYCSSPPWRRACRHGARPCCQRQRQEGTQRPAPHAYRGASRRPTPLRTAPRGKGVNACQAGPRGEEVAGISWPRALPTVGARALPGEARELEESGSPRAPRRCECRRLQRAARRRRLRQHPTRQRS